MAEFDINRIRYTWKGVWTTATAYKVDDIVKYGGSSYACLRVHTSGNFEADQDFLTNPGDSLPTPAWQKMTDGFAWRSTWAQSTIYAFGDIVLYGGVVYVCIDGHTSSSTFEVNAAKFSVYISLYNFTEAWTQNTRYGVGDLVVNGGIVYRCITEHTSASNALGLENDQAKWAILFEGIDYKEEFAANTKYVVNDLIKYGGTIFRCIQAHTSSAYIEDTRWLVEFPGFGLTSFRGLHGSTTYSVTNSGAGAYVISSQNNPTIVLARGVTYTFNITASGHPFLIKTSPGPGLGNQYTEGVINNGTDNGTVTFTVPNNGPSTLYYQCRFHTPMVGRLLIGMEWSATTYYAVGDLVLYGGYLYRSETNNYNKPPEDSITLPFPPDWTIIAKGSNFVGDWSASATYKTGDVVRRGGYVYEAIIDTSDDGSTLDYLDTSNWKLITKSLFWKGNWNQDIGYAPGDTVHYLGVTYSCNYFHTSTDQNYPGDNGSGYSYWDVLIDPGVQVGMNEIGDLLTYDLSRSLANDQSTLGPTRVPIGNFKELLSVDSENSIYYKDWGLHAKVRYVSSDEKIALDDISDPTRGISPFRPWRTIRYACEQVEKLGLNSELVTIKILPGKYEEVLPIVVPSNVALRGDELRSVTVKPKLASNLVLVDLPYSLAALQRIRDIIEDLLLAQQITPSQGNTENQQFPFTTTTYNVSFVPPQFDENYNEIYQSTQVIETIINADMNTVNSIRGLIDNIDDYLNYNIYSLGTAPVLSGSNDSTTDQFYLNGIEILLANIDFLAAEAIAFTSVTYPLYNFDENHYRKVFTKYIESWAYDLEYAGNYKSLAAARFVKNLILGSELEDMFYVRDGTGIRNMTLSGLNGSLTTNVPIQDRRPTAGAYVSLDPGWGPDDEKTWITTRSCYVQNVTTFGNGATGQKIDGALHNGGNKSIVSNDFTQVISDGIGAWVTNNGRAELVSVFTYYAHIGMFAENGGVIRATNGNSSYGTYGAFADGNDDTETPSFAFVNNRTQQAVVARAFAGESNDEILVIEYANAGQNYSSATFNIVGSGAGAAAQFEEIRDNGIFEAQIRNSPTNAGATPGGNNYKILGNNAQFGDSTSLTIASNDESTAAEVLGLRIIITSGPGTGQYGYVAAFNEISKQVTVRKESTGELGWDHVVPGYPNVNLITTNSVYRFEPRPIFSDPGFTATTIDINSSLNWANVVYGETLHVYNGISGTSGEGVTIGVAPANAIFNVTKNGRSYVVTLVSGGAGYELYQTVTIDGADVGGISGEHDITITVTEISDDSTNSILDFSYEGIAQSGYFISTADSGNTYVYSLNGVNWTTSSFPLAGNYKSLTWGENTFVTIAYGTDRAYTSTNGINWTQRTMPASRNWVDVAYGDGIFVAIASNQDSAAWSTNGTTWNSSTIPDFGDSSFNEWQSIAYGNDKFIAVSKSANASAVGVYDSGLGSISWTVQAIEVGMSPEDWTSIAYGNGRFVAVSSSGDVSYTFDGVTWETTNAGMPSLDGSTPMFWKEIKYAQGVFFAICDTGSRTIGAQATTGPTTFAATSYDGINWIPRTLSKESSWTTLAFGNPDINNTDSTTFSNSTGMWVIMPAAGEEEICRVFTGARALGRVTVESGKISEVSLWEPGSGYLTKPTLTLIDPNNSIDAYIDCRTADGVLAQPVFSARGSAYKTSSTQISIVGNGFADIIPNGSFVYVSGLSVLPGPGAQFRFRGESQFYTVITEQLESVQNGTLTGYFRISPGVNYDDNIEHSSQVEIRTRYSQVRISGHDFLDVGTGNFVSTNYPGIYTESDFFSAPENEVVEANGGRVFYTSTDQSGNFRTGELFAVEQATGIVTISADFFDLGGLTELALGGVRLGGSGTVVREFSTDQLFTADSNNVVPTQRAIKAYLANRLNVGGSDLLTASFIAGTVKVGPNEFDNTANLTNNIPVIANFPIGTGISGSWLALLTFTNSFS